MRLESKLGPTDDAVQAALRYVIKDGIASQAKVTYFNKKLPIFTGAVPTLSPLNSMVRKFF